MKQIAIIGPTASGKSDIALKLADSYNANILSIDSLSIYKEIDIASAKPSKEELLHVKHFGIDIFKPDEDFNVATFIKLYKESKLQSQKENKNLIIAGGSSFYLKALLNGLSDIPEISEQNRQKTETLMFNISDAYDFLYNLDSSYMKKIARNDTYRIEKMLNLYFQTQTIPTQYFRNNPPTPTIDFIDIFNIEIERDILRKRIMLRTDKMLENGLIDEIAYLEHFYGRSFNSMKAIGIIEVLEYFDGLTCKSKMRDNIITHTAQLAKRQQTFNNNQFDKILHVRAEKLYDIASKSLI